MLLTPEIVQCGRRGQIVIPKEIRKRLGIREADFDLFAVGDKGIFLKLKTGKGRKRQANEEV